MTESPNRRPLASRGTAWAQALTRRLAARRIAPNRISQVGIAMAALSGAAFWLSGESDHDLLRTGLLLGAALFCQLRLLCNLLDGMVAIEAGRSAPDGVFWNEVPDRAADILILVGAGYGVGLPALGWAAAAFAVLTAYIREIGRAATAVADFSGPLAKPQRMAAITLAALVSILEPLWDGRGEVLTAALWVIALGTLFTALRRAARLLSKLRA